MTDDRVFTGTFEEEMERLNALRKELERDDLTLEEALTSYREAEALSLQLKERLDQAELEIRDLEGRLIPVREEGSRDV